MSDTETAASVRAPLVRTVHAASQLLTLAGNLIPLYGVLYWDWDTFQLLMLYWMETAIIAFWTLRRLAKLPESQLGTIKVNRVEKPATRKMLVGFFSMHAAGFILAHLLFLWLLFSGPWLSKVHAGGAVIGLIATNGVWIALALLFAASWISFVIDFKPGYVTLAEQWLHPGRIVPRFEPVTGGVGGIVGTLYLRIVIMQVAIIFGAMLAQSYGTIAPLLIVIALKTLSDLALGAHTPSGKGMEFSANTMTFKS